MKAPGLFIKYSIAFLAVLVLVPHITNATTKDKFLTYSEKTDFVKTPKKVTPEQRTPPCVESYETIKLTQYKF